MKTELLELGLKRITAESDAEDEIIVGITDLHFENPICDALANNHGNTGGRNWCIIPDGRLDAIQRHRSKWAAKPWDYDFKPRRKCSAVTQ